MSKERSWAAGSLILILLWGGSLLVCVRNITFSIMFSVYIQNVFNMKSIKLNIEFYVKVLSAKLVRSAACWVHIISFQEAGVCGGPCNPSKREAELWGWLEVWRPALLCFTVNQHPHWACWQCPHKFTTPMGFSAMFTFQLDNTKT